MKKLIISFMVMTILLTGCSSKLKLNSKNKIKGKGQIYKITSLKDKQANVNVFTCLLPKKWKASLASDWNNVNSTYPGIETVTISSPDSLAHITIISQNSYIDSNRNKEGINYDYYNTYMHYMDSDKYLEYYMDKDYNGAKYIKDIEISKDLLKQVDEYNKIRMDIEKKSMETINVSNYGISYTTEQLKSTMSKKQYEWGNNYLEATTAIGGYTLNMHTMLYDQKDTLWQIPYIIVYSAEDKKTFDKYYDDYNFIITNASFTVDYYALEEYVSSKIINLYTSIYAAKSKAALDATNDYIDANYSSTSAQSTNDKVMEMWDDVINEVDTYEMEDGSKIKVSMYNDTVAQDGNNLYIGSSTGVPSGYKELSKAY